MIADALIAGGEDSKAVICKFFNYLFHMHSFYAGRIQLSIDILIASISNVAKKFHICTNVSFSSSWTCIEEYHELTIKSKKHMSVTIEIKLSGRQWAETFCDRLFNVLAKEVGPLKVNISCSSGSDQHKRVLGGYIDYCLNRFCHLTSLGISCAPISMLPLEVTKRIMKFNQLSIDYCGLQPDLLLQMSQRIFFMDKLEMKGNNEVNNITGVYSKITQLNTPFTTFKTIDIYNHGHGRTNYIVKVCLNSCIVIFYVDRKGKNSKLTSESYAQVKAMFPEFIINRAYLSFLKINGQVFEL